MAEGWSTSRGSVLCRYFMHGACQEGTNCRFSHDRSHQPSLVCRYYMQGNCSYGAQCRYDHQRPNRSRNQRDQQNVKLNGNKSNQTQTSLSAPAQEFHVGSAAPITTPSVPLYSFTIPPSCPYLASLSSHNASFSSVSDPHTSTSLGASTAASSIPSSSATSAASGSFASSYHRSPSSVTSNMTVLSNKRTGNTNSTSSIASTSRANDTGSSTNATATSAKLSNTSAKASQAKAVPVSSSTSKSALVNNRNTAANTTAGKKKLGPVQLPASSWADAPEFVPRSYQPPPPKEVSWANIVGGSDSSGSGAPGSTEEAGTPFSASELCPYFLMHNACQLMDQCPYIHGLVCELCQLACLDPRDPEQNKEHAKECARALEAEMEHSFAVARSQDKQCGICMDTVMERSLPSQRRFGILPNCSHIFCLDCIRKWRQSKQFENKIIRSCPECRIQSDYIIPSRYWVDETDKEEKKKLVDSYREALGQKECKYFNKGEGTCPFGNKCFYRHALADGTIKDVGPPRRRRKFGADGERPEHLDSMVLWDFMDEREHRLELLRGSIQSLLLELELDDLADTFYISSMSDSDSDL
ncbi:Zinc finger C3HC4 RING-type [Trinorchestia longiramus]|nr:Zinc finger C3HC4 RING-type [Trinorchestia longiramus]